MMTKPVFRFAPSPNGHLHLGHAYSALLNQKMAREVDGKLLLRIEDIDTQRCTAKLEAQMLRDLEWIGFEWDETPRRQSEHFEEYAQVLDKLAKLNLVYPSSLSRGEIKKLVQAKKDSGEDWPTDPDGSPLYPGKERDYDNTERLNLISSVKDYALRLNIKSARNRVPTGLSWTELNNAQDEITNADPTIWGDIIIGRKGLPVSYFLCCTYDDGIQDISHVVRGKDLYHSTSIHVLLLEILGYQKPLFYHHDLILDDHGEKLSKSLKHTSLKELKASGVTANDIREKLGFI